MDSSSLNPVIVIVVTLLVIGFFTLIFWTIVYGFTRFKCCCKRYRTQPQETSLRSSSRTGGEIFTVTNGNLRETWSNDPPSYSNLTSVYYNVTVDMENGDSTIQDDIQKGPSDGSKELPTYNDVINDPHKYSKLLSSNGMDETSTEPGEPNNE